MTELADPALAAEVEAVFGAQAPLAHRYADLLATDGILRGMIGPREADRVWTRHMFNSTALAALIPSGARVLDLGAGAGLPGIPVALARPDLTIELLEPMLRRVRFLHDVLDALSGVSPEPLQLTVLHARAEAAPQASQDVVIARAVAPLPRLVELAFPLLTSSGRLLALKGDAAAGEAEEVERLGGWSVQVHAVDTAGGPTAVVEVRRAGDDGTRTHVKPNQARTTTSKRGSNLKHKGMQ